MTDNQDDTQVETAVTGHLLGGRYELSDVLGRGGMAEVRRGRDIRLGRTVAVKTLRLDLASDATFQARFRREAQSAASLNHPSIVAVYDTGEDEVDGVRVPYIVMEYCNGRTLRELLNEESRILPDTALEITAGVLSALEYSHRAGIVHRDIKPANVMLTDNGEVKVMDFGIARAVADAGVTMTQTAAVVGTAQYLSPEQARGETADARSDIYSTGCLLYELLTGRPPFVGDSIVSVAVSHVREDPAPPSAVVPSIAREVDAIVLKALAKDRDDRYQSAGEMRLDIERALAGRPVVAAADTAASTQYIPVVPPPSAPEPEPEEPAAYDDGRDQRRRRIGYIALGLSVLMVFAVAGILGYFLFRGDDVKQARIPSVVGLTQEAAEQRIEDEGFDVGDVTTEPSRTVTEGTVISQDPGPNDFLELGSPIDIVVSSGPERVRVPSVIGDPVGTARVKLEEANLRLAPTVEQASELPAGQVIAVDPPEGTSVEVGTEVTLTVSSGEVPVPNVVGEQLSVAQERLVAAGFEVFVLPEVTADVPAGQVISQTPTAGSEARLGTRVAITVAEAPEPSESPSPDPSESPSPDPTG